MTTRQGKIERSYVIAARKQFLKEINHRLQKQTDPIDRLAQLRLVKMMNGRLNNGKQTRRTFYTDTVFYIQKIVMDGHNKFQFRAFPLQERRQIKEYLSSADEVLDELEKSKRSEDKLGYITIPLSLVVQGQFVFHSGFEPIMQELLDVSIVDLAYEMKGQKIEEEKEEKFNRIKENYGEEFGSW